MEEKNVRKFKIYVEERTTADGRKFNVYKTVTKNGRMIDAKFRKSVTKLPTEKSWVTVPEGASNISTATEYPVLWISEVSAIEPITGGGNAESEAKLTEYFG